MEIRDLIENALVSGDFTNHFTKPRSALDVAEPVVVEQGAFARGSRIEGEERGVVPVSVLVVREVDADAGALAASVERFLRRCPWERHGEAWPWRVVGVDTSAPFCKGRDSSGRFVWQVDVEVTAVRAI